MKLTKFVMMSALTFLLTVSVPAQTRRASVDNIPVAYDYADVKPSYSGGLAAAKRWVANNVRKPYVEKTVVQNIKVDCIIETDGTVTVTNVSGARNPQLNQEVRKTVEAMPCWTPGKQKGTVKRVSMSFDVELTFRPQAPKKSVEDRAIGAVNIGDGTDDLRIVKEVVIEQKAEPKEDEKVYYAAVVEQQPSFPGGDQALYKWLSQNIEYPAVAIEEGAQGRVVVQFVIDKEGSIQNVQVVRGRHPALDKEAVRLVKAMPKWLPGKINGNAVKCGYTLPVSFKL